MDFIDGNKLLDLNCGKFLVILLGSSTFESFYFIILYLYFIKKNKIIVFGNYLRRYFSNILIIS